MMHTESPRLKTPIQLYDGTIPLQPTASSAFPMIDSNKSSESPFSKSVNVPVELLPYITSTSKPHDIYSTLQESRDRRLRLLLRRFTNQIQYGCKNPHCDVSTCLSHRKRHSSVPVRQYNDVAVRALAWKCVEDYASGRRAAGLNDDAARLQKRAVKSKRVVRAGGDGLCYNEPVVPWYEDPIEFNRRRRKDYSREDISSCVQQRETQKPTKSPRRSSAEVTQDSQSYTSVAEAVETQTGIVETHPDHTSSSKRISGGFGQQNEIPKHEGESQGHVGEAPESRPASNRAVRFQVADKQESPQRERLLDTSSFSQSFYNTVSVRAFDMLASTTAGLRTEARLPKAENADENDHQHSNHMPVMFRTTVMSSMIQRKSVPTFRLLPTSALIWLRHVSSRQPNRVSSNDHDTETQSQLFTELDTFARQSIYYCLSDPLRLILSAQYWQYFSTHRAVKKARSDSEAFRLLNSAVKVAAESEVMIKRSDAGLRLPSIKSVVQAVNLLTKLQPYTETLNHLFAALQHAYILPANLRQCQSTARHNFTTESLNDSKKKHRATGEFQNQTKDDRNNSFLDDDQTAYLSMLVFLVLINAGEKLGKSPMIPWDSNALTETSGNYLICRDFGHVFPHAYLHAAFSQLQPAEAITSYQAVLTRIDAHDNMHFLRLLESFADVISHRLAVSKTLESTRSPSVGNKKAKTFVQLLVTHLVQLDEGTGETGINHCAWVLLDLMCLLLLKVWDRQPIIRRTSSVGGALQMLAALYRSRKELGVPSINFSFQFVAEAFDDVKMPVEWMAFREDSRHMHILSFSFLFEPATLVRYFRAVNIEIMRKAYEYASFNYHDARHFINNQPIPVYGSKEVLATLRPHMAHYFVLTIGRTQLLEDAINQIWRRQKQELMRPLKVVLGKDEGEDGLDHGGVQQEFFRLVFAEAMDQDFGMFTVDSQTRMAWFQPGSLEPLYKFEALGILLSLAVYNGLTIPVTLPLAFYRKLLRLKVKNIEHITDGWPTLTKGLQMLLDWQEGDVGDVMARTYEFSYEAFGSMVTADMTKVGRDDTWPPIRRRKSKDRAKTATFEMFHHASLTPPSEEDQPSRKSNPRLLHRLRALSHEPPRSSTPLSILSSNSYSQSHPSSPTNSETSQEAPLVTNANRVDYVKDYIFWLTNKSIAPQYEAFAKGFYTCLDPTALSIFTPEALQSVVEGHTEIDIEGLEATTTYDDYEPNEQIIKDFWSVVRDFSPEQHGKLLEFVTASARVPVNGIRNVTFLIQRNGVGDERLPSSSTCYGRLLLPRYSSKEILREKLAKAIENSVGFGSL